MLPYRGPSLYRTPTQAHPHAAYHSLVHGLDPSLILHASGHTPDPWWRQSLASAVRQVRLICWRQAGKFSVVSDLAVHHPLLAGQSRPHRQPKPVAERGETGSLGRAQLDQEYNCLITALEELPQVRPFPDRHPPARRGESALRRRHRIPLAQPVRSRIGLPSPSSPGQSMYPATCRVGGS
jgi:hypothetical protein